MKYLLIFFIVMVLVFQWRSSRTDAKLNAKVKPNVPNNSASSAPQSMVACAQCGLHVPTTDAVQGRDGAYCSAAHLRLRET
jgi:uncharacterized protein